MKRLANFRRLSTSEQWLALKCWMVVWLVRVGLWVIPLATLRRWIERESRRRSSGTEILEKEIERLSWLIALVSRRVPRATCLTQALALQAILVRRGSSSSLKFGVKRDASGHFAAHAWVERDGAILIGGEERAAGEYVPLPQF